jgi:hypothetical protein
MLKNTNKFGVALKVTIVFLAVGYIALRLFPKKDFDFSIRDLFDEIKNSKVFFTVVILLMPVNWLLESWKWKIIASQKIKISFADAMRGVLAGVTIGTATPNRVGEFAGRIFMVKEGDKVELLLLSFISSFTQVLVTVLAGVIALILSHRLVEVELAGLVLILLTLLPLLLNYFPGKWLKKIIVLKKFPFKVFVVVIVLSAVRYIVYASQFLFVILIMNNKYDSGYFSPVLSGIAISYLLVTLIPTFSFTEVLVRGSVAGMVFGGGMMGEVNGAFYAAIFIWFVNVAVPSLVGTVFVFRLKFFRQEK